MTLVRRTLSVATLIPAVFAAAGSTSAHADAQPIVIVISPTVDCFGTTFGGAGLGAGDAPYVNKSYVYATTDPTTCG